MPFKSYADDTHRLGDNILIHSNIDFIGTFGTVIISPRLTKQEPNYKFDYDHGADVFNVEAGMYDGLVRFLQKQVSSNKPCREKYQPFGPTTLLLTWSNGEASGRLCTLDDDTMSLLIGFDSTSSRSNVEFDSMVKKTIEKLRQAASHSH